MNEKISIPEHLDEFEHYLVWQLDEIIFVTFGLIIGLMFRQPLWGLVFGYFIRAMYVKTRDGKPHGYIIHRTRELGFMPQKIDKGTSHQPALVDEFIQ